MMREPWEGDPDPVCAAAMRVVSATSVVLFARPS